MPTRSLRPCVVCGTASVSGRCPRHPRNHGDRHRPSAAMRGYDRHHQRWRLMVLANHPVCPCGQPATEADHVIPLREGGGWSLENGQGLCKPCHSRKTATEAGSFGR